MGHRLMNGILSRIWPIVALLAQPAWAETRPMHQPLEIRHVCEPAPVFAAAGRDMDRMLDAGTEVTLTGFTFGPDAAPYFIVDYASGTGLQRRSGFVAMEDVRSFCPAPPAADGRMTYHAPPNTCHLTVGWRSSIAEVDELAAGLGGFRPSMAAYRVRGGGYALSLGLLNLRASTGVLRGSQVLPAESDCVTGADFVAALVQNGDRFAAPEGGAEAKDACDLGLASACTAYAEAVFGTAEPDVVTRYGLLACMAGDPTGCKLAINRQGNTLENAQFRAIDVGTESHLPLVTPELARMVCDTRDNVGCILLARGTATYTTPTPVEAVSNFAANLTACQTGGGWVCQELIDGFQPVYQARGDGASPSADENYALAALWEGLCTPGATGPSVQRCDPAYRMYGLFLQYGTDDEPRIATARSLLERGCEAGDPYACSRQTTLADHWPEPARNAAAARAVALCAAQTEKDGVCGNLSYTLDPALPEASPAVGAEYDRLAEICRKDQTGQGAQACSAALFAYANLRADDGLTAAETMLRAACTGPNTNGCGALAFLYGTGSQTSGGTTITALNDPQARLAALRTGCTGIGGTCLTLASALADAGDADQAMLTYARSCELHIKTTRDRADDVQACYEAAKFALAQAVRYPDALRWSRFACDGADTALSPYGCKLQGNILANGLGADPELELALAAYREGCFHPRVATTDGESCLNYGNMLVSAQDELAEASRAFDMGCQDSIRQACDANRKLLNDQSVGAYPGASYLCRVQNDAGQVTSEKTCRGFIFYQGEDRNQIPRNIYVWPDGDRTVTYTKDGTWFLNEVVTAGIDRHAETACWRNPISARTFCAVSLP